MEIPTINKPSDIKEIKLTEQEKNIVMAAGAATLLAGAGITYWLASKKPEKTRKEKLMEKVNNIAAEVQNIVQQSIQEVNAKLATS